MAEPATNGAAPRQVERNPEEIREMHELSEKMAQNTRRGLPAEREDIKRYEALMRKNRYAEGVGLDDPDA